MPRRFRFLAAVAVPLAACAPPSPAPAASPAEAAASEPAAPAAPAVPATDVFLFALAERDGELRVDPAGGPEAGVAGNLTDREGYDNQPAFTPDGRAVLYTSIREDAQADIYRYDLATRTTRRLTHTAESEYSPTPAPDGGISVVRVEADSTQRLWRFDADGRTPRLVLEEVRPVGYHAWLDPSTLALFVLGTPPTLRIADTRTGRAETVAENIGRSIHRVPGRRAVGFVHKLADGEWLIRSFDLQTRELTTLAPTLPGAEDFVWTPGGALLMGRESVLYRWNPDAQEWWEVADLHAAGVRGITRLAVSARGDRIAVVGIREAPAGRP